MRWHERLGVLTNSGVARRRQGASKSPPRTSRAPTEARCAGAIAPPLTCEPLRLSAREQGPGSGLALNERPADTLLRSANVMTLEFTVNASQVGSRWLPDWRAAASRIGDQIIGVYAQPRERGCAPRHFVASQATTRVHQIRVLTRCSQRDKPNNRSASRLLTGGRNGRRVRG